MIYVSQLLLAKRLYIEAGAYVARKDSISCGIAVSLLQDASESYIWTLIKERGLPAKDQAGFTAHITTIQNEGILLPNHAKLLELNKVRVNFKHYGILPILNDAKKYQIYVEDFLRAAMLEHFKVDFDDLSLVDLVVDVKIREQLKSAEARLQGGKTDEAAGELAKAKTLIFAKLQKYIPRIDSNLRDSDRLLNSIEGIRGARTFSYVSEYLGILRESCLVAMFRIPIDEYSYVRNFLPSASETTSGVWNITHTRSRYNDVDCRRALSHLVNLCITLEVIE